MQAAQGQDKYFIYMQVSDQYPSVEFYVNNTNTKNLLCEFFFSSCSLILQVTCWDFLSAVDKFLHRQ